MDQLGHLMDELLQLLLGQVVQLHLQSERLLCDWLVRRIVVLNYMIIQTSIVIGLKNSN